MQQASSGYGFQEALRQVMYEFRITGSQLCRDSGVSPQQISGFKNKQRDLLGESIEKIVRALPVEARKRFLELSFFSGETTPTVSNGDWLSDLMGG